MMWTLEVLDKWMTWVALLNRCLLVTFADTQNMQGLQGDGVLVKL